MKSDSWQHGDMLMADVLPWLCVVLAAAPTHGAGLPDQRATARAQRLDALSFTQQLDHLQAPRSTRSCGVMGVAVQRAKRASSPCQLKPCAWPNNMPQPDMMHRPRM